MGNEKKGTEKCSGVISLAVDNRFAFAQENPVNPTARCVILVLSRNGSPIPECEERLRELERRGYIIWRARGSSSDDSMRSQLASDALANGFDELMWIGGEIVFDPNDIDRLREHNLPIVGAMVAKTSGRQFAAAFLPGEKKRGQAPLFV